MQNMVLTTLFAFAALSSLTAEARIHHHASVGLPKFYTEAAAKHHCPQDTVVWLNTRTGIWHYKGQRWYHHTNNGAFACEREAARSHTRATRNGQ